MFVHAKVVYLTLGYNAVKAFGKLGLFFSVTCPNLDVIDKIGNDAAFYGGLVVSPKRLAALKTFSFLTPGKADIRKAVEYATSFAIDTTSKQTSDPSWDFSI